MELNRKLWYYIANYGTFMYDGTKHGRLPETGINYGNIPKQLEFWNKELGPRTAKLTRLFVKIMKHEIV